MTMTYDYEVQDRHGNTRSRHRTWDAAEKQLVRNLGWHCRVCGSHRGGWGKCRHGRSNWVCSAVHYNDRVVRVR